MQASTIVSFSVTLGEVEGALPEQQRFLDKLGVRAWRRVTVFATLLALTLYAPTMFAASTITTSIDGGGQHATSANYAMDNSVGGIGGISSASADTAKNGYIGELTEVVSITVTSTPSIVNEDATSQLSGTATLDDNSVSVLPGSDIAWASAVYPLASIDSNGLAMASSVYATTNGAFSGFYLSGSSTGLVAVIDSNPDNYGSYSGDGIPDSWQVQYFGTNNPNAAPGVDVDGTGQNNLFKYVAGLDPTNPSSIFVLQIASVTGQPTQKNLIFNPEFSGRTYTPQFRTNLVSGAWAPLAGIGGPVTNVNQVTVTDLGATQAQKFYRIDISLP
jgi:hypothetical protein